MLVLVATASALAACNATSFSNGISTGSTPRPSASLTSQPGTETALAPQPGMTAPQAATNLQGGTQPAPGQFGNNQQVASVARIPPVAFLPVTGAPQSAVTKLAGAMRNAARSNAVPVVVSVDRGAQYQLKGYFSALNDGSGAVLVYVWDVLDARGVRIHRISGQERGGSSTGDPWAGISDDMISRVANTTMNSLRSWATTRAG
ncbi:MAG: hypothetical protein KDJ90_05950 [Nitratireductor sp.]|nr:hypothetical protein [Nitratireductor sp.]